MTDLSAVEQALSASRLAPYVKAAGGGLAEGLALYEWNDRISAAFFQVLRDLEVGLRDATNRELVSLASRTDWWHSPRIVLTSAAGAMISQATTEVARRGNAGTPGHVIAALPFGFWVGLFSSVQGRAATTR